MNVLGILGRYGPVRRTTAGRYRTWCPVCRGHSLLVVTGTAGDRPASCVTGCLVVDVVARLKGLDRPTADRSSNHGLTATGTARHRALDRPAEGLTAGAVPGALNLQTEGPHGT